MDKAGIVLIEVWVGFLENPFPISCWWSCWMNLLCFMKDYLKIKVPPLGFMARTCCSLPAFWEKESRDLGSPIPQSGTWASVPLPSTRHFPHPLWLNCKTRGWSSSWRSGSRSWRSGSRSWRAFKGQCFTACVIVCFEGRLASD